MFPDVTGGEVSQRPRVIDGQVTIRNVLDRTLAIDHNVVGGAPAAASAPTPRHCPKAPPCSRHRSEPGNYRHGPPGKGSAHITG